MKGAKVVITEDTGGPQRDIQSPCRMTLGKDEDVIGFQDLMMQADEQIEGRQVAADMAHTALKMHLKQPSLCSPHKIRKVGTLGGHVIQIATSALRRSSSRSNH